MDIIKITNKNNHRNYQDIYLFIKLFVSLIFGILYQNAKEKNDVNDNKKYNINNIYILFIILFLNVQPLITLYKKFYILHENTIRLNSNIHCETKRYFNNHVIIEIREETNLHDNDKDDDRNIHSIKKDLNQSNGQEGHMVNKYAFANIIINNSIMDLPSFSEDNEEIENVSHCTMERTTKNSNMPE